MELARAQSVCYIYWQLEKFTDISWQSLVEEFTDTGIIYWLLEEFADSWFVDIGVICWQK